MDTNTEVMKFLSYISFLFVFALSTNVVNAQTAETSSTSINSTETFEVRVKGVGCMTDVKMIRTNITNMAGVTACEAQKTGAVTVFAVTYDPALLTKDEIHAVVEDTPGCKNPADRPYRVKL